MNVSDAKKALSLVEEYVLIEANLFAAQEAIANNPENPLIGQMKEHIARFDYILELQIKAIANYAGNILNAIEWVNIFTESGRKGFMIKVAPF